MDRWKGRWKWWILGILAVMVTWVLYASYKSPPRGSMGEVIGPDEPAYVSQIIDSGIRMLSAAREKQGDGVYRRDAHAKTHACVAADFTVNGSLDSTLRVGLFSGAAKHKAWVRFSSGKIGRAHV